MIMSESIQFKESVRGIVEYVLKGGSLDDRFVSRGRALEGTIAHGKLQRDNEKVYQDYEKEVILKHEFSPLVGFRLFEKQPNKGPLAVVGSWLRNKSKSF